MNYSEEDLLDAGFQPHEIAFAKMTLNMFEYSEEKDEWTKK